MYEKNIARVLVKDLVSEERGHYAAIDVAEEEPHQDHDEVLHEGRGERVSHEELLAYCWIHHSGLKSEEKNTWQVCQSFKKKFEIFWIFNISFHDIYIYKYKYI